MWLLLWTELLFQTSTLSLLEHEYVCVFLVHEYVCVCVPYVCAHNRWWQCSSYCSGSGAVCLVWLVLLVAVQQLLLWLWCCVSCLAGSAGGSAAVTALALVLCVLFGWFCRMDKRKGQCKMVYPDIIFSLDNFQEVFSKLHVSCPGEKFSFQLVASNKVSSLMLFLFC